MDKQWDVLGFGAVTVDDLIYVERFPMPDTKVAVLDKQRQGGGLVGTALVAAARLGARTAYAGVLGDDDLSAYTLAEFKHEGVDCTPVLHRSDARPIHSMIIVDRTNGQRSIMASFVGVQWREPNDISVDLVTACRVLFVDHHAIAGQLCAAEIAHQYGIPVVADIERESEPRAEELVPLVDHLIVSIQYARRKTGESNPDRATQQLAAGRTCCVVTAGEQGCWYAAHGSEVKHFPAFPVHVVDTTGCGDVFHGAYAAMIAREESIERAVQIASAAAAMKATQPGGRAGIPTLAAIEQFLR